MKGWLKITLLILFIFIAVGSFYYLIFSSFFEGVPSISRNSYLELNIFGEMPERGIEDPLKKLFSGEIPSMAGLRQCIRKAKIDPNIIGIIIRPFISRIGWAKIEELQDELNDFKKSGKPVYVYLEIAGNKEFYLSLSGDMVFGAPQNVLFINGFLGRGYFLGGILEKVGIKADFIAHGKYKNAPDMFTRKTMSDGQSEVINSILDDYYNRFIEAISSQRGLSKQKVRMLVDKGLFTIQEAYDNGLVDTMMFYIEFEDFLKKKAGKRVRIVSYERYKKIPFNKLGVKAKHTMALIYGIGDIVNSIGDVVEDEGYIPSEAIANSIRKAAEDKSVKAIVFRINSPGGSGIASDIIWREMVEARKKKPVVVSFSDFGASGGYYIAMSADSIVAEESSIIGSIGVYAGKFSLQGLYSKIGINKVEIPRGANANLFSEKSTFSLNQKRLIQKSVDDFYRVFVSKVAESRNMTYEQVNRIGQGRVWTGAQAAENGLVDKIGGLSTAFDIAKKMVNIPREEFVMFKVYPRRRTLFEKMLSGGIHTNSTIFNRLFPNPLKNYLLGFLHFMDYEPLLMMPFYPEID